MEKQRHHDFLILGKMTFYFTYTLNLGVAHIVLNRLST